MLKKMKYIFIGVVAARRGVSLLGRGTSETAVTRATSAARGLPARFAAAACTCRRRSHRSPPRAAAAGWAPDERVTVTNLEDFKVALTVDFRERV